MKANDINNQMIVEKILNSKKYRDLGLNPSTITDLVRQEAQKQPSEKALKKSVRRKLHNIVAPYLGEPNYNRLMQQLTQIPDSPPQSDKLEAFCIDVLSEHASTAERISNMTAFYNRLFQTTGKPATILDLACGLHPLAFLWMGLSTTTQYYAYDIIQPRIDFINQFFLKLGLRPLAENRDVLINPPVFQADLAIFFKEAHRFEKRQPGCNRTFWESLDVDILAVSLPVQNLSGTHSLLNHHRNLVDKNLPENRTVSELMFENEIVFLIERTG